ncbi:hypothetical protein SUGI_0412760 [Cryptomeria japonica]|uniref:uncharacterized protein LOC131069025 n=1 Tax=Cryptomeria japonica TaxID=3369 RepID=UPI002408DB5E|nr:uncharacterized protein LOC131069025 [Cryptomeria japonica]GLJ22030.1 hypothetical protein SUGI_0412760 [Cryptomeria japonica]
MARKRGAWSFGTEKSSNDKAKTVLRLLQKDGALSPKQKSYCDETCVERFLKARGNNAKKAAKQLRACLTWRDSIPVEHLIADEFSAELAQGVAFVAGRDDESRPVIIVRMKQDQQKPQFQKLYTRLLVFTLEVAIASMLPGTEQCVLVFDAGYFRSGSTCLSLIMATLKILADYYPGRLAKAFVVDPPSMFNYLWKGVRPFVDFAINLHLVSSRDYDSPFIMTGFARASSLRHDYASNLGSSFRFSCKVASENVKHPSLHGLEGDRYLAYSLGPALISPLNARSFSFASPATSRYNPNGKRFGEFQSFRFEGTKNINLTPTQNITTPSRYDLPTKPSIFSPREGIASFFSGFKRDNQRSETDRKDKNLEHFQPYLKYYRLRYNEIAYRSMMKPPLGGLASIVSPELKRGPSFDLRRGY